MMRHFILALACAAGWGATAYAQNPTVQVVEMGTALPDHDTYPAAINSRGVVAGYLSRPLADQPPKAFTWTRTGGYRILLDQATVSDINDIGVVVGSRRPCGFDQQCDERGYVWTASTGAVDLGEFQPTAINNKGTIVGYCTFEPFDPGETEGCIRANGAIRKLPGRLLPLDINERGAVVGYHIREDGAHRAAVWASSFGVRDLDAEPLTLQAALAINEGSIVVGRSASFSTPGRPRAAVWTPVGLSSAPQGAYSSANSVSDRGWVVGEVSLAGNPKPALWLLGARLVELPTPGGNAGSAWNVNDAGLIVGTIHDSNVGGFRSVLWIVR